MSLFCRSLQRLLRPARRLLCDLRRRLVNLDCLRPLSIAGGGAFSEGLLRTDSCRRAEETRTAFAARGTLVEPISG